MQRVHMDNIEITYGLLVHANFTPVETRPPGQPWWAWLILIACLQHLFMWRNHVCPPAWHSMVCHLTMRNSIYMIPHAHISFGQIPTIALKDGYPIIVFRKAFQVEKCVLNENSKRCLLARLNPAANPFPCRPNHSPAAIHWKTSHKGPWSLHSNSMESSSSRVHTETQVWCATGHTLFLFLCKYTIIKNLSLSLSASLLLPYTFSLSLFAIPILLPSCSPFSSPFLEEMLCKNRAGNSWRSCGFRAGIKPVPV